MATPSAWLPPSALVARTARGLPPAGRAAHDPPAAEALAHAAFPSSPLAAALRRAAPRASFASALRAREAGARRGRGCAAALAAGALPTAHAAAARLADRAYSVRFSARGALAAASQGGAIRVFDVARSGALAPRAAVEPQGVQWTVTHVDWLGEDALLYSSMNSTIRLAPLPPRGGGGAPASLFARRNAGPPPAPPPQRALELAERGARRHIGVFAFAVAPGGVELTAATSDGRVVIYDIEGARVSESFEAHADDINAVAYAAGTGSGADVIITGSDDGLLKVFDRRAAAGAGRGGVAAAVLPGHRAGVTSVAARGDGRYVASNGKDQALRVWDLRRCVSAGAWAARTRAERALPFAFDYRMQEPRRAMFLDAQPGDASVATLRGHTVLRTLIRAQWSPLATTGGRFLASGSAEPGGVFLWDLLDVCGGDPAGGGAAAGGAAAAAEGAPAAPAPGARAGLPHAVVRHPDGRNDITRDVSWHPTLPLLASSSWAPGAIIISSYSEAAARAARAERVVGTLVRRHVVAARMREGPGESAAEEEDVDDEDDESDGGEVDGGEDEGEDDDSEDADAAD